MLLNETQILSPELVVFNGCSPSKSSSSNENGFEHQSTDTVWSVGRSDQCPSHLLPVPAKALKLLEEITGWVVEFEETKSSYRQRQLCELTEQSVSGKFSIVDMSADWPVGMPTGHRGKCDQLVEILNGVVLGWQETERQLMEARSKLAAVSLAEIKNDESVLADSFIPRYADDDWDNDFDVQQLKENLPAPRAVNPPFEGWQLAGAQGYVEGRYIDWQMNEQEQIELIVGRIEGADVPKEIEENCPECTDRVPEIRGSDGESKLTIDPLTREYQLTGDDRFSFWLFDQRQIILERIPASSDFLQLKPCQWIIVSTSPEIESRAKAMFDDSDIETPQKFVAELAEKLGMEEKLMVLSRDCKSC